LYKLNFANINDSFKTPAPIKSSKVALTVLGNSLKSLARHTWLDGALAVTQHHFLSILLLHPELIGADVEWEAAGSRHNLRVPL
jgi:hypothetical protein